MYGGALQAWRLTGGEQPPELDADGLRAWSEPGWVKAAMDFRLTPRGNGTELSSETRVVSTDDATRRRFARYWVFVQPGSTAIRWEVLTAVELRAKAAVDVSRRAGRPRGRGSPPACGWPGRAWSSSRDT